MKVKRNIDQSSLCFASARHPTPINREQAPINREQASEFGVRRSPDTWHSAPRTCKTGVALIITLIMLAVITFMAVTFLVLSQRERGAVATTTYQTTARFTTDTGSQRAMAEILARIVAFTNDQVFDLIVSTNFVNRGGFDPLGAADYRTNVNYDYTSANTHPPLSSAQLAQNIANLFYDPRPPVFVNTNQNLNLKAPLDFRYYLDLNRNGRHDANGYLPVISSDPNNPFINATNGLTLPNPPPAGAPVSSNYFVGDPEWIGILEHPDQPHSANNKFIGRYAYLVVPAGKTLDVNYVHNDAKWLQLNKNQDMTIAPVEDGFARNQGVGSWEINLGAFFTDLNTNQWQPAANRYTYRPLYPGQAALPNQGTGFEDAFAFLRYRYDGTLNSLSPANQLFPNLAGRFRSDGVDEYSDGPLWTNSASIRESLLNNPDPVAKPWPGADNTNHFFAPQDFFDKGKIPSPGPVGFVDRLLQAGADISSYDRYTFYRMMAQLGTDSGPERNKINVNYLNVDTNGNVIPGMETNLISWDDPGIATGIPGLLPKYGVPGSLIFFTNAAARLFSQLDLHDAAGNPINLNYIPVWPTNYYTPAIHRALQLAANVFESMTNAVYPCIYRPYFIKEQTPNGTNVYISGYELVNGHTDTTTGPNFLTVPIDLNNPQDLSRISRIRTPINVYGVPWIIGARKGLPNFNEIAIQSVAQITRKLLMTRPRLDADFSEYKTFQMYLIGISNTVGVEVWNSYRTNYPRQVYIQAEGVLTMTLTNDILGFAPIYGRYLLGGALEGSTNIAAGLWPGTGWVPLQQQRAIPGSFVVPLVTNVVFITDKAFQDRIAPASLIDATNDWSYMQFGPPYPQPVWGLDITNNLRCMIFDGGPQGRIVDYVQLGGLNSHRNLGAEVYTTKQNAAMDNMWGTNLADNIVGRMPLGLISQIEISRGNIQSSDADWANQMFSPPSGATRLLEIAAFQAFLGLNNDPTFNNTNLVVQVPFTPTSKKDQPLTWQANDPLVHYTADDLYYVGASNIVFNTAPPNHAVTNITSRFWRYTDRYDPWLGNPTLGMVDAGLDANMSLKDPMVRASDDWSFPTNSYPNIGWLGRVHRGTPWQTIYLKASEITNYNKFTKWTGNQRRWAVGTSNTLDVVFNRPTQDRLLFETFTAALNDNATRGAMSVNQSGLAAWSALLSGVIVLTNNATAATVTNTVILPARLYDSLLPPNQQNPLVRIWMGINSTRANTNLAGPVFPNHLFAHAGDVLATPQLTEQSPFLDPSQLASLEAGGLSDAVVERIPQQVMSLLTLSHTPRFVIYSYGQTLKPAEQSLVTSGQFFGLCTNYQVTAEAATRAVVRVEGAPQKPRIVIEQFNVLPPD